MLAFGTNIVAGVTPGKGGEIVSGIPVFNSMDEAVTDTDAACSVIFVPAKNCLEAATESLDSGIEMLVIISEHVPLHDSMKIRRMAEEAGSVVIGPNSPGLAIPGSVKIGIMPNQIFRNGNVAVLSRSGTLTYEVVQSLTEHNIGQSFVAGIGGDPVVGSSMARLAGQYLQNNRPDSIVLIGEIGGMEEQRAARDISSWYDGPVVSFIAGRSSPPGKRMGHAGAIIDDKSGSYDGKTSELRDLGVHVCAKMSDIPNMVKEFAYN